uniref:GAG-pre-integrase domain-containing protein n=1 Tax=Lactuca sativa TaxID=4236 RepID=A0A9R1WYL7_LACSA|nr:hypothetical protein LSAT_V11C800425760 [Lactuca sativa]
MNIVDSYTGDEKLQVGNGNHLSISHVGSSSISHLKLPNVLIVPNLTKNLLSVSKLTEDNDVYMEFWPKSFSVKTFQGQTILQGDKHEGLYRLPPSHTHKAFTGSRTSLHGWHKRLAHPHEPLLRRLVSTFHLPVSTNKFPTVCYICLHPHTSRLYISRHVIFNEDFFPYQHLNKPQQSSNDPNTSADAYSRLQKAGDPFSDPKLYRQVVGSLQYATITRPDIAYSVNRVCQFMHSPTNRHWQAVKRILRYLKGTITHCLHFTPTKAKGLHAFFDCGWISDTDDSRSQYGFVIFHGSNLISWTCRKQKVVARSSTEAEYRSLAYTTAELMWLKQLVIDLQAPIHTPPLLLCDNVGAIFMSKNPVISTRSKHIALDFHFIREQVEAGELNICHVSSVDQLADLFTKPLGKDRVSFLRSKLQVLPALELAGGGGGKSMMDEGTPYFLRLSRCFYLQMSPPAHSQSLPSRSFDFQLRCPSRQLLKKQRLLEMKPVVCLYELKEPGMEARLKPGVQPLQSQDDYESEKHTILKISNEALVTSGFGAATVTSAI